MLILENLINLLLLFFSFFKFFQDLACKAKFDQFNHNLKLFDKIIIRLCWSKKN